MTRVIEDRNHVRNSNPSVSRYGYHVPRTNKRDNFYKKLEEERAAKSAV